jgi:hypothetical protein
METLTIYLPGMPEGSLDLAGTRTTVRDHQVRVPLGLVSAVLRAVPDAYILPAALPAPPLCDERE